MSVAWSFSALESFETCPYKHFKTKIEKSVADPPGAEAQWGTRVHKALELRLKDASPLVGAFSTYEPYAAKVASMAGESGVVYAEQKIALTEDLTPTTFFAKDVWVRMIVDVTVDNGDVVTLLDWKTGKRKESTTQLELTAAVGASVYPEARLFKTGYIWLKEKRVDVQNYAANDAGDIWGRFMPRVERLNDAVNTGEFPKKPSGLCRRWCPVKQCEYCGQ